MAISNVKRSKRQSLIRNIQDLPTISTVIGKLVEMVEDEKTSAKNLADLIAKDQSILSVNLKLVNSAFYGYSKKITSIQQATVILGFNTVKSMALGAGIFKTDSKPGRKGFFDRNALWIHSLGVATASKALAKKVGYRDIEEAFVAGLLHDVGKVVFDAFFHVEFSKVVSKVEKENILILEAERDVMDFDHADAGKMLLEKWKLPVAVTDAVGFHHKPDDAPEEHSILANIVHLADIICRELEIGSGGDNRIPLESHNAVKKLGCDQKSLGKVIEETAMNKEKIEMFEL